MIDWSNTDMLKDETANGKIWREIAMIQAQRKTAEQMHLIAQTLSTLLELHVESVVQDPSATVAAKPTAARLVRIRQALGEIKGK